MKHVLAIFFLLASVVAMGQKVPPAPNPPRLVNDLTKSVLEPDQVQHLEEKLVAYDDSTSIQIAVVIVPELQGYEPVDYALTLGREWGVGNKKTNNGVVLLISMEQGRRKVFIAPGYGMEGVLPDIICKQIIENEIIPQFKQDHYYRGISDAVDAIIAASHNEYKAPAGYNKKGKGDGGGSSIVFIIILVVVLIILRAGRGGGPKGGMHSRRGYHDVANSIFWLSLLGGRGGGGGGGGWGGGGSGGGGGFGGFGGGSFGGGGAGGSW
ncbi:MAG TPA: TPM domain-containing protein [Phnomibacter sp.]|nr:TPM domain-containing protein [Phnomibacter sp.]